LIGVSSAEDKVMSSLYVLYAVSDLEITARRRSTGIWTELNGMLNSLRNSLERRRAIRELSQLPERMLQDIGIERAQIEQAVDGTLEARSRSRVTVRRTARLAPRAVATAVAA